MLVAKKTFDYFYHDKIFLSQQKFVVTNICRDNRVYCDKTFVSTSILLSRQAYFCATNNVFVATKVTKAQFCHDKIIIIMYIYHALIKALSAHMIHMIFYTHVEDSPTKTIYIKYYIKFKKKKRKKTHYTYARTHARTHAHTHTHTHTLTVAETGY